MLIPILVAATALADAPGEQSTPSPTSSSAEPALAAELLPAPGRLLDHKMIVWMKRPNGSDIGRAYPDDAARKGVGGSAMIQCAVDEKGRLAPCTVLAETPSGAGFGAAALKLARVFQMRPTLSDGTPVAGTFLRYPLTFFTGPPPQH